MSIDGGSPAVVVQSVFNSMWDEAVQRTAEAGAAVNAALGQAATAPKMDAVTVTGSYSPPGAPGLPAFDPRDAEHLYQTIASQLNALIGSGLTYFMATFFPDTGYFDDALTWIDSAIKTGGTGIRASVEQQLWERGRARILSDSARAEDEAAATWANRRFPVPPGALTNQINQIRLDAGQKLAETSRDIAVKSFDAELENVRFAVKTAVDVRASALSAMNDYVRTLLLGPQTAATMANVLTEAQSRAAMALTQMYAAEVSAAEPLVRMALGTADIQARVGEANLRSASGALEARVRVAMEYAQMLGNQAAAGLNALHASAAVSGSSSDSTVTSISE